VDYFSTSPLHATMPTNLPHSNPDLCPHYLSILIDTPFRRWLHNADVIFTGLVQPGQTVLDLGCGPGTFTLALARLVGETGHVIAVDLQLRMLDRLRVKAEHEGLVGRIEMRLCTTNSLELSTAALADFALAFWMLHEVPDADRFLREVWAQARPGGSFLLVEPVIHVSARIFQQEIEAALAVGWRVVKTRSVRISRSVLLEKPAV
jgi:ubiquinone/menaquinone biosynthesis C-methylase UbiE